MRHSTEAVKKLRSINVPLQQHFQRSYGSLSIRSVGGQHNGATGNDAQGHDTKQALGIHATVAGFDPDGTAEFICLLHKVCSLLIVQA